MMEELKETTPVQEAPEDVPQTDVQTRRSTTQTIGIVLAIVVIVFVISAIVYGMVSHPPLTAVLRDISIIVLALVTIVIGAFLAILILQIQSLTALLRDEIKPILESANETANTVRGTTTFVSDAVVSPMISAASYVAAVRQAFRTLAGSPKRRERGQQRPNQE